MNEDELRDRIGRLDPVPDDVAVEPLTTPSSRARMEQIMNTPLTPDAASNDKQRVPTSRTRWIVGAVAALALVVAGLAITTLGDDDSDDVAAGPPLVLTLGAEDLMASCAVLDPAILGATSPAFAGTATAIDGEIVTLTVDRWYAGGDEATTTVELTAQAGMEALIGGFALETGEQYLISATEGSVNFCGLSGPASPELQAVYDQAFPS